MTDYKAVAASLRACTDPQKRHAADVIEELLAQLTPPEMTPEEEEAAIERENQRHEREQERAYDAGYNAGWSAASREYANDF